MFLIIEGPDRSGKSTLCNKLLSKECFDYVHFTSPKPNLGQGDVPLTPGISVFNQILDYVKTFIHVKNNNSDINLICDRFIYSDMVYGPLYRAFGPTYVGDEERTYMEKLIQPLNPVVIHCQTKSLDLNWKLVQEENEGILTKEFLKNIRQQYTQIFNSGLLKIIHHEFDAGCSLDDTIKLIFDEYNSKTTTIQAEASADLIASKGFGKYLGPLTSLYNISSMHVIPGNPDDIISYEEYLQARAQGVGSNTPLIRLNSNIYHLAKYRSLTKCVSNKKD